MKQHLRFGKNVLLSLALAVSLALTSIPLPAQAATFVVDDTPLNNGAIHCPLTIYTTIQAAVNAAPAGATITVCQGVYSGNVLISGPTKNGLKLKAKGMVTVEPPLPIPASGPVFEVLSAINVTIHGFIVNGAGRYGTTGSVIYGIAYANSSGTITNNVVTGFSRTPMDNSSNGIGIFAENTTPSGPPLKVNISKNTVQGYQYAGIVVELNVLATVTKNKVVGHAAGNKPVGIWLLGTPGGKVEKNTVSHDWSGQVSPLIDSFGIELWDSNGVKVTSNKVNESAEGILLKATCGSLNTTNGNTVSGNTLRDGYNLIWLFAASGGPCPTAVNNNLILKNKLYDYNPFVDQYGIWLDPSGSGAVVTGNHVSYNVIYGFLFGCSNPVLYPLKCAIVNYGGPGNVITHNKVGLTPPGGLSMSGTPATPASHDNTIPEQTIPSLPLP